MSDNEIKLAQMVSTRLCHDLAGPLGAVNNGVEFWRENDGIAMDSAIGLVESSAKEAVDRLLFYRQALGMVHEVGETQWEILEGYARALLIQRKANLQPLPSILEAGAILTNSAFCQSVLNLMLCVSDALIHGGEITLQWPDDDGLQPLKITGRGKQVKYDPVMAQILEQPSAELTNLVTSRNVHGYLAVFLAHRAGLALSVKAESDVIIIQGNRI
jgi:histidine phosphotransferase ChpT